MQCEQLFGWMQREEVSQVFRESKLHVPKPLSSTEPTEPEVKATVARGGPLESKSSEMSLLDCTVFLQPTQHWARMHSSGPVRNPLCSKVLCLLKSWVFLCKPEFYSSWIHTNLCFVGIQVSERVDTMPAWDVRWGSVHWEVPKVDKLFLGYSQGINSTTKFQYFLSWL